jgi:hypothetical protein
MYSLSTHFFPRVKTYFSFVLLKWFLHFCGSSIYNPATQPNSKLNKFWPVFSSSNTPEYDITVHEILMLYRGRLGWIQYIPLRSATFRIKSYLLCDSKTGCIWFSIIYTAKGAILDQCYKYFPLLSQIVLTVMQDLLDKGYCLTADNYYSSPQLADILTGNKQIAMALCC